MRDSISIVLNVYKRSHLLAKQLWSIQRQSIAPSEILVWENGNETTPKDLLGGLKIARANHNFGVWARFSYALNAGGEYICVIDDDTIPGKKWLENCLETIKETPGLLGARGVIFDNKNSYSMNKDVGIYNPNDETTIVDIVGHSWFFKKEWLAEYWSFANKRYNNNLVGEDIHFSFVMQQIIGLPTLVPRHPTNDFELWGSNPELSKLYGSGVEGISTSTKSLQKFEKALQHYRRIGFKTISEMENQQIKLSKHSNIFYMFVQKFPRLMHKLAKIKNRLKKGII